LWRICKRYGEGGTVEGVLGERVDKEDGDVGLLGVCGFEGDVECAGVSDEAVVFFVEVGVVGDFDRLEVVIEEAQVGIVVWAIAMSTQELDVMQAQGVRGGEGLSES